MSSEGLTGAGGPASQMLRSPGWQADAGFWKEILVLQRMDLLGGLLECSHAILQASPSVGLTLAI